MDWAATIGVGLLALAGLCGLAVPNRLLAMMGARVENPVMLLQLRVGMGATPLALVAVVLLTQQSVAYLSAAVVPLVAAVVKIASILRGGEQAMIVVSASVVDGLIGALLLCGYLA